MKFKKINNVFLLFMLMWIGSALIAYWKYPYNYVYPNFFAEDGQHFYQNIYNFGIYKSLLIRFNGYYIFGIYILTELGLILNQALYQGSFTSIPRCFSIISYLFFGLCASLPILLLRKYLKVNYLVVAAILIAFMPFPTTDYQTLGVIGNLKFAFGYISFILTLYRISLPKNSTLILPLDFLILICIYTVATSYFVLPVLLINVLMKDFNKYDFSVNNLSTYSFILLGSLSIIQIIIIFYSGLPNLSGYLDEPYQFSKTIEIFIARSFLFPLISGLYGYLNDNIVTLAGFIFITLIFSYHNLRSRIIYIFGAYFILFATVAFVYNRTGVSIHYNKYSTTGFDNFFYAQNFVFILMFVTLWQDIANKNQFFLKYKLDYLIFFLLLAQSIFTTINHSPNYFMHFTIGTLQSQLKLGCASDDKVIKFKIFPFSSLSMSVSKELACGKEAAIKDDRIDYVNNNFEDNKSIEIGPNRSIFTQEFIASQKNLSGIAVYISTYWKNRLPGYSLYLMDKNCNSIIRMAAIPNRVQDNSYIQINFDPIPSSYGQIYCFSIRPDSIASGPLVLHTSEFDKNFKLRINGSNVNGRIIFATVFN